MPEFFEYDPVTGITTWTADLSAVVDHAKAQRNAGIRDKGIKENWWHYAYVPPIVMNQMQLYGIDTANDMESVFKYINEFYPDLRTSDKWHDSVRAKRDK